MEAMGNLTSTVEGIGGPHRGCRSCLEWVPAGLGFSVCLGVS